jgi:hypothetical protein
MKNINTSKYVGFAAYSFIAWLCTFLAENGEKRENGTNGREKGVRKKGTHVSSSPPFVPFSLF